MTYVDNQANTNGSTSASKRKSLILTWNIYGKTVMLLSSQQSKNTTNSMQLCFNVSKNSIGMIPKISPWLLKVQQDVARQTGPNSTPRNLLYLFHTLTVSRTSNQTITNPSSLTTSNSLTYQEQLKFTSWIEKIQGTFTSDMELLTFLLEFPRYSPATSIHSNKILQSQEE